ncbi:MAG TPA: DUF3108 domain-containing protein [Opitutus sp.]|nr:DUF3108 domain-containing protein [Opitutus sp.]
MKVLRLAATTLVSLVFLHPARATLALYPGEALDYRVSWGIFLHAGEIKINAHAEADDRKQLVAVNTTTSTRGFLSRLFRFEARSESVFDPQGRMLIHTESSAGGRKKTNISLEFNYADSTFKFTDFMNTANNEVVSFPPGDPMDLITSLIQTRTWDIKPGEARDILVLFEKDVYQLTVHALEYEQVETPLGTFKTLKLEPRMEKTPPKGMFKRGSKVHVWIAQDDPRHLPVRFEVEFAFGAGVATLVGYQPPTASVVPPPQPLPAGN